MALRPAAILCIIIIIINAPVPVAAGRALHKARLPPPPASAAVLQTPLPPSVLTAASEILQQPPAADQQPAATRYCYCIHVTGMGFLCVLVSFLAGCFLCALFIFYVSRSTTAATSGGRTPRKVRLWRTPLCSVCPASLELRHVYDSY
ncbi:hypothetical protein ZWY2020_000449 [Hordeum vulgare]|nr:hypothetical protein ZWY2020_000449 [Hordeum vulgare]